MTDLSYELKVGLKKELKFTVRLQTGWNDKNFRNQGAVIRDESKGEMYNTLQELVWKMGAFPVSLVVTDINRDKDHYGMHSR